MFKLLEIFETWWYIKYGLEIGFNERARCNLAWEVLCFQSTTGQVFLCDRRRSLGLPKEKRVAIIAFLRLRKRKFYYFIIHAAVLMLQLFLIFTIDLQSRVKGQFNINWIAILSSQGEKTLRQRIVCKCIRRQHLKFT